MEEEKGHVQLITRHARAGPAGSPPIYISICGALRQAQAASIGQGRLETTLEAWVASAGTK